MTHLITRRRFLALFVAGAIVTLTAAPQGAGYVGFEQITVAASAIGFTSAKIRPAGQPQPTIALCRSETAQLRWTIDGTVPTSSVGMVLEIGDTITITGNDLMGQFRSIRTTATSATLDCTYTAP